MADFTHELNERLDAIREQGLYRELRCVESSQAPHLILEGKPVLNFSSNDYLGLANEPALKEAAFKAIERYGVGSGASRLICGSLRPHHELEDALAAFKGTEAALAFSSGYATALGTLCALLGPDDVIVIDKLVHASVIDAARLCGAKLRVFGHNDLDDLESILKWADERHQLMDAARRPRTLIVTESIFSMDGDFAELRAIVELKEKYGAWLMLDEAHATGLFGQHRRGLAEAFELAGRIEIQMGTLGKALGAAGGYICGPRALIELLINRARSFIFSTAPMPASVAAATAGVLFVQSDEGEVRRSQLWARVDHLKNGLVGAGWSTPIIRSAVVPLILGAESTAVKLAAELRSMGVYIPAIRYPTVPRDEARLRLTITAAHNPVDIAAVLGALAVCQSRSGARQPELGPGE